MNQHNVDLLPASMRARSEARAVASRNATIIALTCAVVVTLATHARLSKLHASSRLEIVTAKAAELEAITAETVKLQARIDEHARTIDEYWRVETPIPVSRLIASVTADMPASMSLERLDFQVDRTGRKRSRAASPEESEIPPRILSAELTGFAYSDLEIASFVMALDQTPPFENVQLDFSRQRLVRGVPAREFRMSFQVDLGARYVIADSDGTLTVEGAHVE